MFVDGIGERPVVDVGGQPVVWVDGVGVVQDPNVVGPGGNVYLPPALFKDAQTGATYLLDADFHLRPSGAPAVAAPAPVPASGGTSPGAQPVVVNVTVPPQAPPARSPAAPGTAAAGGGTPATGTTQLPPGAGTGAGAATALTQFGNFLGTSIKFGTGPTAPAVPLWALALAGYAVMSMGGGRRRRNPGKAARAERGFTRHRMRGYYAAAAEPRRRLKARWRGLEATPRGSRREQYYLMRQGERR